MIGGGSWATALVRIFSDSGVQVMWYLRSGETVDFVKTHGKNPNYLSFLPLKKEYIFPTAQIEEAIRFSDFVLFAVPSAFLESTVSDIRPEDMEGKQLLTSIKGIVPRHGMIPSDFLSQRFGLSPRAAAVIGGPCHAEEVALEKKTYVTIAAEERSVADRIASSVRLDFIRTIINDDPMGVEIAAIMKNIIGVACGIAHGLNYGDNFQAVLVSNALGEVQQFLTKLDGKQRNLANSSYFGDLLVTAYSEFSRNRMFGQMIGRGYSVHVTQKEMNMVAEGYYAVEGIYAMARKMEEELPVISTVYRILYNKISPYVEFKLLEQKLI